MVKSWSLTQNIAGKNNPFNQLFLPPANEVRGKAIFSEACVKNSVHRGACGGGHAWLGAPAWQGGMLKSFHNNHNSSMYGSFHSRNF